MSKSAVVVGENIIASPKSHYAGNILPIRHGPGFNENQQLAFEAVSGDTLEPVAPTRDRAMGCAGQLYVFALSRQFEHAALLTRSLRKGFEAKQLGGWIGQQDAHVDALRRGVTPV
jgi:mannose/cellobiose epimerase-like protein (N-acyl-D-glucosamine 2-epimerase family)